MLTSRIVLWLALALIVVIALLLYRSRFSADLRVTPHAAEEIEKAKRR